MNTIRYQVSFSFQGGRFPSPCDVRSYSPTDDCRDFGTAGRWRIEPPDYSFTRVPKGTPVTLRVWCVQGGRVYSRRERDTGLGFFWVRWVEVGKGSVSSVKIWSNARPDDVGLREYYRLSTKVRENPTQCSR